jgi:uncharacterized protein
LIGSTKCLLASYRFNPMPPKKYLQEAVLKVGEVNGVDGRTIYVLVDKNKNLSDLFLDGDILKNISVNSYIEIRKGFLSIIGRVEGEQIEEDRRATFADRRDAIDTNKRILTISLSGYIDEAGIFTGGTKELPLIGNPAYILTREKIHRIHNLVRPGCPSICIATSDGDDFEIEFPVDGLFNSHIAIFGNTGSGKTNTLAYLYQELVRTLRERNEKMFSKNARFVLFDFNGEYVGDSCITKSKTIYNLSTESDDGEKLPMEESSLLDIEVLSILADATDKTQKPFLKRTLRFFHHIYSAAGNDPEGYLKNIIRKRVKDVLQMSDKLRASLLLDYFEEILPPTVDDDGNIVELDADIEWHNQAFEFKLKVDGAFLRSNPDRIKDTILYKRVEQLEFPQSLIGRLIVFLYVQLINDVLANRAQNEHIAPVINRLKGKRHDIDRIFDLSGELDFWQANFVVVNLHDVSIDMKKTLPLIVSRKLYADHKKAGPDKSLSIIIDEAHNILSTESARETENWKEYRLETFEEIIKEGRKFGVFVTISSQRPNDISPTITSQAHNYFIHRLVNQLDLETIGSAVSYIDKVTKGSIPTLPTGTCVFSGMASQMPLKINVKPLEELARPKSATRAFSEIVPLGQADK